ncbi:hypothetical protein IAU59_001935 [Kwoniella sp. CBS 9459]
MEHVEELQEALDASDNERIISTLDTLAVKLREAEELKLTRTDVCVCYVLYCVIIASLRESLGQTRLATILVDLTKSPDHEVLRQTGRVAANLVIDNDSNRSKVVESGYIDAVLALPVSEPPVTLPIVASLHNLVVDGHESSIASLRQPLNTRSIQSWTQHWTEIFYDSKSTSAEVSAVETPTITQWLWAILSLLTTKDDASSLPSAELITLPLMASYHNLTSTSNALHASSSSTVLADSTHYAILSSACRVIEASESLKLVEEKLDVLLDFVEHADLPSGAGPGPAGQKTEDEEAADGQVGSAAKQVEAIHKRENEDEDKREEGDNEDGDEAEDEEDDEEDEEENYSKSLGASKAAIVRALVSQSSDIPPQSSYWIRMREWLEVDEERADLLNCALLSLGNSIRDDASAISLLPAILPTILRFMDPSTKGTTQHSLIGLVKNLSVPAPNKVLLGEEGVIEKLVAMRVFDEERDLLGSVQGGAAGILKNLCKGNVSNAQRLLSLSLPSTRPTQEAGGETTPHQHQSLDPILALMKRTDDPAIRFECTRIFVNIIKSLAAAPATDPDPDPVQDPHECQVSMADSAHQLDRTVQPLVDMLRDAGEYPVLQQEAVIALALLATFSPDSKPIIIEALEPHLQILQNMTQNERREIRENASTLLRQIQIQHA